MPRTLSRLAAVTRSVTIRDVAATAGVSVATVSRVFNRNGPVRDTTFQRVRDVARNLHYFPHAGARSLSTRKTNTIGVVLPELYGEFFSEVIRGIDVTARQSGYHLLVSGSHSERDEMCAVMQAVRGRVDGLIVMSPDLEPSALLSELPAGFPVVVLNSGGTGYPSITIDNSGGARAVVRHLLSLGHRHLAFICGPPHNVDAEQRRRGYRDAARAAGIGAERSIELPGNFTEESGYAAATRIATLTPRPAAVFAANDAMAIGALSAFRKAKLRVPDDIALAGFDDIPISRYLSPPLTTVKVPIADLGRRGFQLLFDPSIQTKPHRTARLPTSLIVRESCGAHMRGSGSGRSNQQEESR